eukprot:TRINITY_DN3408_c0_g1_i2.p1 TRINITY_DN3408_c0_g1~~TRINITY_DN3408_c0_g1_i2.p1  ORF type:complete len:319 (+),score=46.30 TRINITY_DN3408_c0_g1_i2:87-1043(+)
MIVSTSVKVRVISGHNLLPCDLTGKSDPYCHLWSEKQIYKTHVIHNSLNPKWDESFVFSVDNPKDEHITLEMYDHDTFGSDDVMGGTYIPLHGLTMNVENIFTFPLSSQGEVTVGLTAIGFDTSGKSPQESVSIAISEGKQVDPTQIPVFRPPQDFRIADPKKFYSKQKCNHSCGSIQLFLDKPYYLGGEVVRGRVELIITTAVQADALKIKWSGREKTLIENTVTRDNRTVTEKYHGKKTFFKDTTVLVRIDGNVLVVGTHSFLFEYQLPNDLPGVYYEKYKEFDKDKIKGIIGSSFFLSFLTWHGYNLIKTNFMFQ